MIVYGLPLSPFVRKVLVYGEERGLGLVMRPTTLGSPDTEFLETSPFAKIPGFRDEDFTISDSSAIVAYLEAKFPDGALMPSDPREIATTVWYEEFADTIALPAFGPVFFNRVVARLVGREADHAAADLALAEAVPKIFDYLEPRVDGAGAPLVGGKFGIADISVASVLMNLCHADAEPDAAQYPNLTGWIAAMHARPSFVKWRAVEHKIINR